MPTDASSSEGAQNLAFYSSRKLDSARNVLNCVLVCLLLFDCVAQYSSPKASQGEVSLTVDHKDATQDSMGTFRNSLVDKLFGQVLEVRSSRSTGLDNRAFKTHFLSPPPAYSSSRSPMSHFRSSGERIRPISKSTVHGLSAEGCSSCANVWSTRSVLVAAAAIGGGNELDSIPLDITKLPANVDETAFKDAMLLWAKGLTSSANLPFVLPLDVKEIDNGFQIGFLLRNTETGSFASIGEIVATVEALQGSSDDSSRALKIRRYGKATELADADMIIKSMPVAIKRAVSYSSSVVEGKRPYLTESSYDELAGLTNPIGQSIGGYAVLVLLFLFLQSVLFSTK